MIKKDDRYNIQRTSNRNSVATQSEGNQKLERVLNKLAEIARAVANEYNLDERLVFEDFVKDLRILNDPRAIAQLDPSHPIDVMTRQLLSQYIGNEEDFNVFRNSAVDQIMNMTNEQAVQALSQYFRRNQIGTSQRTQLQRGASQRALPRFRDSKADEERFAQRFGEKNLVRFKRLAQRLQGHYRDMTWVTANIETTGDLNDILNNAEFYGYEPIAENEDYIVFDIDNLEMCQKLAGNANWCITAPTAWNTNARFGARYHFYINKNTGEKYCVAMVGNLKEIVDGSDNELAKLPVGVPMVGGAEITSSVVQENTSSADALMQTVLRNIEALSVDTLREAYDDLFGEDLDMLEDDEVKEWLTEQVQEMDTNELKTYIEHHIDEFAVVPQHNREIEELNEDDFEDFEEDDEEHDLDYERSWGPEDEEEFDEGEDDYEDEE